MANIIYQSQPDIDGYIEAYVEINGKVHFIYPCVESELDSIIEKLSNKSQIILEEEWLPE